MRRVSDTGIVRNYCQNNVGGVFDLNYLSKHNFSDIPNVNLRKIVTRLIDQGILRHVSKGVCLIGESDMSDEDIEDYTEYRMLKDLDEQLFSILSVGEKNAIEVLEKGKENINSLCEKLVNDVYEKWKKIFFNENVEHYHKLNPCKIGLKMKLIREANEMSKTELALRLNINR